MKTGHYVKISEGDIFWTSPEFQIGNSLKYFLLRMECHFLKRLAPNNMAIIKRARKIKKRTLAIDAAPSAMPPNPKIAAIIAITKKITDQRNIVFYF
jgi:aminoglycoside phosphotransferase (APT) family kinase protein